MENIKIGGQNLIEQNSLRMQELMQKVVEEAEKLEIEKGDRNENGELLVTPEGPVSLLGKQNELWWKMTRTRAFKDFFGDWQNDPNSASKIVDINGEPLVVFRGVSKDISVDDFYNSDFYKNSISTSLTGTGKIHVTPSKEIAKVFGEKGIYSLFVNSRKPLYDRYRVRYTKELGSLHDSAFSVRSTDLGIVDKLISTQRIENPEDFYEIVIDGVEQMLVIPSPAKEVATRFQTMV